jgi:uncharacterized Zn-binding protein involved in type VI secretion
MPAMIVLGDKTDHGGEVIEASGVTDTHGKRIARVGDKVQCPKKGHGTTEIVTGDLTMLIDGKAVAYHGCKTSCGAVLISGQSVTTVDFGGGSGAPAAAAAGSATALASDQIQGNRRDVAASGEATVRADQLTFDEQFELRDSEGQLLADMPYTIRFASGELVRDETDSAGRTKRYSTESVSTVELFLGHI